MLHRVQQWGGAALLAALLVLQGAAWVPAAEVNIYSYRQPFLIEPILEAFTKETGIKVNTVFAKEGLIERLKAEGRNSPADVLLTASVGRLDDAVEAGVLQAVRTPTLERNIPAAFRHPEGLWYGLTMRARVIYASKERVPRGAINTYEDLADPRWKGRICTRPSHHPYNVALLASLIVHHGVEQAEDWARKVANNLARKPQGNDRGQVRAISEGICDLSLGNSYYMGAMLNDPDQVGWAKAVYMIFPNQDGRGTHMNISGAGVTRATKHKAEAVRLLEYLSSAEAQSMYAQGNYEYPVKPDAKWSPLVESWGRFKPDDVDLTKVAKLRAEAVRVFDRAGYP
jgi:iron(III) transport system substrate-binding protein